MVNEIYRKHTCGQTTIEMMFSNEVDTGTIKYFSASELRQLFKLNNLIEKAEIIDILLKLKNQNKYGVYYNYHPNSGYTTELNEENGEVKINIIPPKGGVLCAFFSETIIFETRKEKSNVLSMLERQRK